MKSLIFVIISEFIEEEPAKQMRRAKRTQLFLSIFTLAGVLQKL